MRPELQEQFNEASERYRTVLRRLGEIRESLDAASTEEQAAALGPIVDVMVAQQGHLLDLVLVLFDYVHEASGDDGPPRPARSLRAVETPPEDG